MSTPAKVEKKPTHVSFIYIANPLSPNESRTVVAKKHAKRRSLAKYLGPLEGEWAVSVSGRLVHRSEWSKTYLHETDCVVVAPILLGGGDGGGKSILRMVMLVALAFVAGPLAGMAVSATGMAAGAAATALTFGVQAAIMIGGSMLINAILPPPKPNLGPAGGGFDSSPSYGIDGPKNLSTKGIPIPVIYGEAWFAGNYIQTYTENDGDTQYLNMLLNVGEGPIESITDIHINDQPLTGFTGVEVFTRLGEASQELIPYFGDIIKPVNRGLTLKTGIWSTHLINDPVDRVRVDIVMPKGISYLDDEDGMTGTKTAFLAEIREVGGEWSPLVVDAPITEPPTPPTSKISISGRSMSPLRKSYYSGNLDKSKRYELRFTHTEDDTNENKSNSISVTDINEILFDDVQYKHTALLGLRIKLSDQLNGIPKVTYRVKGRKVQVWEASTGAFVEKWTDNPAWIVIDAMTSKRYGGGMRIDRFKLDYFRQWAAHCEANGLKFNGAIDQKTNLWDALAPIFKAGRAQPIRAGTKFQVAIQGKRKPVQLFSMGNIKKDSFGIDWLPMDERANEVTVTYFDKDDFGKQKTVTVHSQKARERGEHPRPTEMTLFGVNNLVQATKEATFAMNMNVLLKTVRFEAPLESIACTIGDVIAVQHDMPKWGVGGLLASGSTTTTLKLDREVTFDQAGDYVAMVRHDHVVQFTSEIETILGNTVFLGFGFNVTHFERFRRLRHVPSGRDIKILESTIDQFGRHGLVLEDASGMLPTHTVQLIDTDVVETINVLKPSSTAPVTSVTLALPLKAAPKQETPWALGLKNLVTGQYSIVGISGNQDLWRKISAIEYSDEAYSDDVLEFKPAPVVTSPVLGDVTFAGFKERRYLSGGMYKSEVEFTWSHSSLTYAYAEVHVSIDGEPWRLVGANASIYSVELAAGELRVKLVPVNLQGLKPNFDALTTHTHVVAAGAPVNPPAPQGVRANARKTTVEIKWGDIDTWAANKNVYRYEVWAAPGQNANILDATLLGITGNDHYPHVGLPSDTYHTYWVRAVNVLAADKKSDFAPVGGLSVSTLPADTLSELFPDGISADELFPDGISRGDLSGDLQQDIDWRNGLEDISHIVSELAAKVETVTDGNKMEVFHRKEAIAGVEAYVRQEVTTLVSQDEAVAQLVTELEARVNDDIAAQLSEEKQVRADADSALSASVTTLQAKVNNDITAAINNEAIARADADSAISAQVNTLSAKVNNDIAAAITNEQVARADADTALSGQISTLTSRMGTAESAISSEATTRANADSALATQITALEVKVGNDITAAISSEATARANADSALTTQVTTAQSTANGKNKTYRQTTAPTGTLVAGDLWFDSDDNNKPYRYTGTAWAATEDTRIAANTAAINSEATTRANADSALATQITTLETKVGNDIAAAISTEQTTRANADSALSNSITSLASRVGTAESAITTEQTARANADTALSGQITTISSRVGTAETSITTQATSINGLKAQYSVKINSNGHVVGFGLSSDPVTGGANTSTFSIVSDKFNVVRPGTTNAVPVFAVDTVNNRVVLQNAIVGDLQSDNYVSGVSGWCLKK